jgi:Ion channel
MPTAREDRRAVILLVSLLVFILVSPFATEDRKGEIVFLFALYWTFGAALVELSPNKSLRVPSLILAVGSLSAALVALYHPGRIMAVTAWAIMALFFGYVSTVLFIHLGRPGKITSGRLYVSVSLYLLLGIFYFAVFNLLDTLHPGSFMYAGMSADNQIRRYSHLYFSLATLTTLGYGDIVPATPFARILSVLEAVSGVLYIAITVARLVSAYQLTEKERP